MRFVALISSALLAAIAACVPSEAKGDQQKFEGVWVYEFEASSFIEGATSAPTVRPKLGQTSILLHHPESVHPGPDYDRYDEDLRCYPLHAFLVSFVGEEVPIPPGPVPGVDFWKSEIAVVRLISAKPIPGPRCYGG